MNPITCLRRTAEDLQDKHPNLLFTLKTHLTENMPSESGPQDPVRVFVHSLWLGIPEVGPAMTTILRCSHGMSKPWPATFSWGSCSYTAETDTQALIAIKQQVLTDRSVREVLAALEAQV